MKKNLLSFILLLISTLSFGQSSVLIQPGNTNGLFIKNASTVNSPDPDPTNTIVPPALGAGTRLMWIPAKSAFRVGTVISDPNTGQNNYWDTSNIGTWSFATGVSTIASGVGSTALGLQTTASGAGSTAMGNSSSASGTLSTAMGSITTASGTYSTAMGLGSIASGTASIAIGAYTSAIANASLSVGIYNDPVLAAPAVSAPTDPLFIIGNGTSPAALSNAMIVQKNGNVGIGINPPATPNAKLDINGNVISEGGSAGFRFNDRVNNAKGYQWYGSGGNAYLFRQHSSPTEVISVLENGNMGIGTNSPFYKLDVAGDINSSTFVRASGLALTSDIRLKRDFTKLNSSLSRLYEVNGYNYFWKDEAKGKDLQTGVIAQELEKVFPELVMKDEKGFLSVNYIGLVPHLIEAVKELVNKNQELKTKNEQMSATIAEILARLDKLESNKNDKIEIINTQK